jgi:hypothetical protein
VASRTAFWLLSELLRRRYASTLAAPALRFLMTYGTWVAALLVSLVCFFAFFVASRRFPAVLGLWTGVVVLPFAIGTQQLARIIAGPLQRVGNLTEGGFNGQLLLLLLCGSTTYLFAVAGGISGAISARSARPKEPFDPTKGD